LYGERPCLAHAAINSCGGLGDSTEPLIALTEIPQVCSSGEIHLSVITLDARSDPARRGPGRTEGGLD
jgi:hypothetical protein